MCPEFPYGLLIEIASRVLVADIGIAIDVGAYEPKFLHGTLEFLGSRGWILEGNGRETKEAAGIIFHEDIGYVIVHLFSHIDRTLRLSNAFDSGLGQRDRIVVSIPFRPCPPAAAYTPEVTFR